MGCVGSKHGKAEISGGQGGHAQNGPIGRTISRDQYYARHGGVTAKPKDEIQPLPLPKPELAKTEEEKAVLKVADVDLNITENSNFHRTDRYELSGDRVDESGAQQKSQLVVRRGQPFDITIKFDRAFDTKRDDIRLIFTLGGKGRSSRGTKVSLMLSDEDGPREWGAKILRREETTLTVRVFTPPNCIVAKWFLTFDLVLKKDGGERVFRYTTPLPIYVIFNPWCLDDQVYMDDEASRQEYVLNDKGRVYRGTAKQISAKPWNFGQFEDFVLECVMWLLDQSELSCRVRGNPVHVVRKVSALVNAPDDGGVLVGNWSGDYGGGKSPLSWVGSVAIIEEYWRTKKPVKFGQCWVFSGVTTTLCRALGIPCRSVTNFASAHDTDGSITIDNYWNTDGQPIEENNSDSVWNFHVWNDVWMARPDLPAGFGGWQAIDATPQETSEGVYCCGPASLEAIKNGLVNLPFDGPFIFAEVNADRVHWIKGEADNWKNTKQSFSVGKHLSAKGPGGSDRMDVSHFYKFPEGTQQERTAVWRAVREGSTTTKEVYSVGVEDMTFDLIERDDIMMGQSFDIKLKANNKSAEERNVKATLTASVMFYTGVTVRTVKSETFAIRAPASSSGEVTMTVKPDEYLDKLVDMAMIKISAMVSVVETKQYHCESDDFRLLKPRINIHAPEQVTVGEDYTVELSFTNPLVKSLTKCEFQVEGAGLQRTIKLKQSTVAPKGVAKVVAKLKARRVGEREIVAGFDSKELADCTGHCSIKVVPPETAVADSAL